MRVTWMKLQVSLLRAFEDRLLETPAPLSWIPSHRVHSCFSTSHPKHWLCCLEAGDTHWEDGALLAQKHREGKVGGKKALLR